MTLSTALRLLGTYVKEWEWKVIPNNKSFMVSGKGLCPFTGDLIHIKAMGIMALVEAVTDALILASARKGKWPNWMDELCMAAFDDIPDDDVRMKMEKKKEKVPS